MCCEEGAGTYPFYLHFTDPFSQTDKNGSPEIKNGSRSIPGHLTHHNNMSIIKINHIITEEITKAVRSIPGMCEIDADKVSQELLVAMGLVERTTGAPVTVAPKPVKAKAAPKSKAKAETTTEVSVAVDTGDDASNEADSSSTDKKPRARTVSAKSKELFNALPGATPEKLKEVMKAYKEATQADLDSKGGDFISFARHHLLPAEANAGAGAPAPEVKEKATRKKSEKNFTWTPASKKIFDEIVKSSGGEVTDELKKEFAEYANAKTKEDYAALAPAGHIRAFLAAKASPDDLADGVAKLTLDSQPEAEVKAEAKPVEEEEVEEFDHDGETLCIGVPSGKIYRDTAAGLVLIGVAGQGAYKSVKVPSA